MKYIIEIIELNDIYFDENDIAQDYTKYEYLVRREDGTPIRQFKVLRYAEKFVEHIEERIELGGLTYEEAEEATNLEDEEDWL